MVRSMQRESGPWLIPGAVLGEIGHLVASRGVPSSLAAFLDDIARGIYLLDCGEPDIARVRSLIERYDDLPLGLVDAAVIACSERNGGRVATLNRRHFGVVAREGTLTITPD